MAYADLIANELLKRPDRKLTIKNDGYWICCHNPEHSGGMERSPSLRIKVDESDKYCYRFYCFGCHTTGHYNDIAKALDLEPIDKDFRPVGNRRLNMREKLKAFNEKESAVTYRRSTFSWPEDRPWREIDAKIIIRDGAEISDIRHDLEEPRLIFPVTMWGERVGEIYALIRDPKRDGTGKKREKSYINQAGTWKESSLFGFDRVRRMLKKYPDRPLWLVEGPRDRYWCEMAGCIVVGNLGSSFSEAKADLIKILNPKRFLVASDADDAGDTLANDVYEHLHGYVPLTRIKFKAGQDPCDIPIERLRQINRRFIKKLKAES